MVIIVYLTQFNHQRLEIEAVSYGILAALQLGELEYTHPLVVWLHRQRMTAGIFISTQVLTMHLRISSSQKWGHA